MDVSSLLGKELTWGRHKFVALLVILVVLPAIFAYSTFAFQHVLPTDAPVGVAPQEESVTEDDLNIATAAVTFFSDPQTYQTEDAAMRALNRERVYAVITVPPDLTDESKGPAHLDVYVSGSVVPYQQPAQALASIVSYTLEDTLPRDVTTSRHIVGTNYDLSEYLIPMFLLALVSLVALVYLPYTFDQEAAVIDRLRVETSLYAVVGSKLAFFGALLLVPLIVFDVTSSFAGSDLHVLSVGTAIVTLLTFLLLGILASALMLLLGLGTWGRIANLLVMLFVFTFSGLAYPVGFFSPARRWFVRQVPTHYSAVTARGFILRDDPIGLYTDWLLGLAGCVVVAAVLLAGTIEFYERRA